MKHDKTKAFELRREGKSYKTISRELGIPLGTLAGWLKREPWSEEIKFILIQKQASSSLENMEKMRLANIKRFQDQRVKYQKEAINEFHKLKTQPLFIGALMLYWGEGEKNPKSSLVRLGNSDPVLVRTFYRFLRDCLKVEDDKIHFWLLLYPDLIETVQKRFWGTALGVPQSSFKKSIFIKGKHPSKRMAYGVGTVYVSSRALKERMLKWIELANNYLISNS